MTREGAPACTPAPPPERFDAWLEALRARHSALSVPEVRKGVRALSSLYVERRRPGGPPLEGAARRAAFATYYAPLHFLMAHHAASRLGEEAVERVLDLGAGTGAAGAAVALALGARRIVALERSGWALGEARRTCAAFGLACRTRRTRLPAGLPKPAPGDAAVCGWFLNECEPAAREAVLAWLGRAARTGTRILVLEPLAGGIAPWWEEAARDLEGAGLRSVQLRIAVDRPDWIAQLDRAAGLDHREIGARALYGPVS